MKNRLMTLTGSAGARQGLVLAGSMLIAGGLDYAFNIVTGRRLEPAEFGILVAVTAILQVMVYATNMIRNVTARYTAELTVQQDAVGHIGLFIRQRWRWAWRWGLVAMAIMAIISPLLARVLKIDSILPLLAASLALLLLFMRPVTDGSLQGLQRFAGLGLVQILQALLRLIIAIFLIALGWQAFGAILALPLASTGALLLALWLLRRYFRADVGGLDPQVVSWQYSLQTLIGLMTYALMINMDAIVVKLAFVPATAGDYGTVVTLGKINLVLAMAVSLVLFPKTAQRRAAGRDPRPILILSLGASMLPGLALTAVYFLIPSLLVETVFGSAYANPGSVLGLVGLATTLFAGLNIWLNYALSMDRPMFVYALVGALLLQIVGMMLFHDTLMAIAVVMVATGMIGQLAGAITTWRPVARAGPIRYT